MTSFSSGFTKNTNYQLQVEKPVTPAEKEPFVVIWSPKNRDEQPELYDTMKRLAEPEMVETIKKNIARKYGIPRVEFQLYVSVK